MMTFDNLQSAVQAAGIAWRGAFNPTPDDGLPALPDGRPAQTIVLLGFTGEIGWNTFAASPEATDGLADPLDRWSRRVIGRLAHAFGATVFYPFGGEPRVPFQRMAQRAEGLHPSPLGTLVHPRWGLWHSYRGALAFGEWFNVAPLAPHESPCDACADKPCLSACPVDAFSGDAQMRLVATKCGSYLEQPAGQNCRERGCLARRACPVGAASIYSPAQASFHMNNFRRYLLTHRT
jgi:hypothetical protein